MCGADGQWIGDSPVCEGRHLSITDSLTALCAYFNTAVQCPTLDSPMNGSLLISGTGVGVYQETATYACETGFDMFGLPERVCQSDASWSGSGPTCLSKVSCDIGH